MRHHLYKYNNDGATRWELQRLINGYPNDRHDRAGRRSMYQREQAHVGIFFCLALGLDLQNMVER